MITAIVTSDNHLGAYYARLRPDRLEARRRALQRAFEQVVDHAIEDRVDLFLHAGDLFDRPDPRNAERHFVARQVRRLLDAEIPIFAIAGNHDRPRSYGYDGGTLPHEEMEALGAIRLFRGSDALAAETVPANGYRVCVWGASADFNRPPDACPLQEMADGHERGGDIDLVLLHYGVEGWAPPFGGEPCLSLANLDRLKADAICVGHLHARQETRLPQGALVLNPGATEHIHFGEENLDCGFWKLHLQPGQVESEYVPLIPQPMRTLEIDLTPAPDAAPEPEEEGRLTEALLARTDAVAQPEQLLRVRLKGRIPRARFHALDLPRLQARVGEVNFHCQVDTEGLVVVDEFSEQELGWGVSFDAGEVLQSVAQEMAAATDSPTEREICRLAGEELAAAYSRLVGRSR